MPGPAADDRRPAVALGAAVAVGRATFGRPVGHQDGLPEGWLIAGPALTAPLGPIWPLIEARLLAAPERCCLVGRSRRLSRGEVHDAATALSAWLPAGARIGLSAARSPASVIATLAIWCAAGAYVPLALELPPGRRAAMAAAAGLAAILADSPEPIEGFQHPRRLDCAGAVLFLHQAETAALAGLPPCYIAHTSGSTGAPKGVMVGDTALLNRLTAMAAFLELGEDDVVLYKTPSLFDVHVWEFALPLLAGATLVVYEQEGGFDLLAVAALLGEHRVTIAGFTPSLLSMLLRRRSFAERSRLRCLLCGGEAWSAALARRVYAALPGIRLFNSYGPTETTIAVASWPVPDDPELAAIELGAPQPNTVFLVRTAAPPADGTVRGMLMVGGAQVAEGYVSAAGRERFSTLIVDGAPMRFYDTGDQVELSLASGALRFAGREDSQVKVNGVRVDLDEVEEAVLGLPGVEACAVLALGGAGATRLCAVVQPAAGRTLSHEALRDGCARLLASPLVPSSFRHVAALPLTPGGKTDRATLRGWIGHEDGRVPEIGLAGRSMEDVAA